MQTLTDALWALVQCGSNFFTVDAVLSRYDISLPASFRLNMGSLRRPELAQWQQCVRGRLATARLTRLRNRARPAPRGYPGLELAAT